MAQELQAGSANRRRRSSIDTLAGNAQASVGNAPATHVASGWRCPARLSVMHLGRSPPRRFAAAPLASMQLSGEEAHLAAVWAIGCWTSASRLDVIPRRNGRRTPWRASQSCFGRHQRLQEMAEMAGTTPRHNGHQQASYTELLHPCHSTHGANCAISVTPPMDQPASPT
ncbi:hypothetical protein VDG39_09620 [Xanthomonas campestris pv. raphani]|nr:hypothetical protein [Xanthomonas campestris]MEA9912972.1 hypothetical protein [Xanthomonas campestris pv. raphani]